MAFAVKKLRDFIEKTIPKDVRHIAVAVSGGPDSLALLKLLSDFGFECDALIVDHGLRDGSDYESSAVAVQISGWKGVNAHLLTWRDGADSRIQEEARHARYGLMAAHCSEHGLRYLFLGHHMDDQAETFLFRLAKGSGLDGLASIQGVQEYSNELTLVRPLLDFPKKDLIKFCQEHAIDFVVDPSNTSEEFARVRLRKSAEILAEEGLTAKRLSVTARRISRARNALESLTEQAFEATVLENNSNRIVYSLPVFRDAVEEIGFRLILKAIKVLKPDQMYLPRMEKIEILFADLVNSAEFRKRTLGGLIFERRDKKGCIVIERENV